LITKKRLLNKTSYYKKKSMNKKENLTESSIKKEEELEIVNFYYEGSSAPIFFSNEKHLKD
jgi:hypothetical protein